MCGFSKCRNKSFLTGGQVSQRSDGEHGSMRQSVWSRSSVRVSSESAQEEDGERPQYSARLAQ